MAMQAFQYTRVNYIAGAVDAGAAAGVKFIAGGTTLIDLMKLNVEQPTTVVDINGLPLDQIERAADGGLKIGAMVRNSDLAYDATVQQEYPVLSVALVALEATVQIQGAQGQRTVPLQEFYVVPGSTPERENVLAPGELITSVTLPRLAPGTRSHYLKRRDRASYEFALASAAVVVQMQGQRVQRIRVALGGIGTKPWRSLEAEQVLEGRDASEQNFRAAAEAALRDAKPLHDNAFKVELAKRTLVRTLQVVTQAA